MKLSRQAKNAILIGAMCSVAYLAVYISRNMLGAITPAMIEAGYTEEFIGKISSFYLIFYAIGQLINGALGDKIKAKYMVCIGLCGSGLMSFTFLYNVSTPLAAMISYGFAGFFLSMIYGPMTKMISENTELIYATRCSLGYTFASFLGSPSAGLLAATFIWQVAFGFSNTILIVMSIICFVYFSFLEKRRIITYGQFKKEAPAREIQEDDHYQQRRH